MAGYIPYHTEMVYPPTDGHSSKYKPDSAPPGVKLVTCWSQCPRSDA